MATYNIPGLSIGNFVRFSTDQFCINLLPSITIQDKLSRDLIALSSRREAFLDAFIERFELEYSTAVRDTELDVAYCNLDLNNKDSGELLLFKNVNPFLSCALFA